jgi:hypothetical protein
MLVDLISSKKFEVDDLIKDKKSINDSNELKIIGVDNIIKYNMMLQIGMNQLIEYDNRGHKDGFKLPIEYIMSHKDKWSVYDLEYFDIKTGLEIIKNKEVSGTLQDNGVLSKITKDDFLEIKDRIKATPIYLGGVGLTIDDCEEYDINIDYTNLTIPKSKPKSFTYTDSDGTTQIEWRPASDFYNLISDGHSTYSRDKGSNLKAFKLIKFYNMDLPSTIKLCEYLDIQTWGDPSITNVFDYLVSRGLDLEKGNLEKLCDKISNHGSKNRNLSKLISHFNAESYYNKLLSMAKESDDIDLSVLDKLEKDDKYKHKVKYVRECRKIREIQKNREISQYYSSMGSSKGKQYSSRNSSGEMSKRDMEYIHKIFIEKAIQQPWHEIRDGYYKNETDGTILVFIFTFTKLDKLDDFKKLSYEFNQKTINGMMGHLCSSYFANYRDCVGIQITKSEGLRLYKWLKKNYFKDFESFPLEDQVPASYKFDKTYYDKLFQMLLELRSEYSHTDNKGKKIEKDLKIYNFRKLINYFLISKDFETTESAVEAYKEFLSKFLSLAKLGKQSIKDTFKYLTYLRGDSFSFFTDDKRKQQCIDYTKEVFSKLIPIQK